MQFKKYQKLRHLGDSVTRGILEGTVYVFPKLDGTNASLWLSEDGVVCAGSRNKELSHGEDNAGFFNDFAKDNENVKNCLVELSQVFNSEDIVLYGEWLVPHTVKYEESMYREFYLFDVVVSDKHINYDVYSPCTNKYITTIEPISVLQNPSVSDIVDAVQVATYCNPDVPEGVVVKNYDFVNTFGDTVWAKCINDKFINNRGSKTKKPKIYSESVIESGIAEGYVTQHLVDKVVAKQGEFSMRNMKSYIDATFKDVMEEYVCEYVIANGYPTINTKMLLVEVTKKLKEHLVVWKQGITE